MGEREPPEEDLFEDLDQFFAPLDEVEWPEEGDAAPDEEAVREDQAPAAEEPETAPTPGTGEPSAPEAEEAARDDLAAFDEAVAALDADQEPEAATPGDEEWVRHATEDLGGAEWEELRAAAAAGEDEPSAPETEGDREGPLTLDDLKSAPPQYADLPGPEEEPVLAEEATFEALEGLGPPPEEPPPAPGPEPPPATEAPEEGGVEAAAEHFAEGVRETPEQVERDLLADLEQPEGLQTVRIDPAAAQAGEEEHPPTWEEGAGQPTREDQAPAHAPPGRDLTAAFVTGGILALAVIVLLAIDKGPFAVFAGIVILLGQGELYAVLRKRNYQPATLLGLVSGALILGAAYFRGEAAMLLGLVLAMGLTVLWYVAAPENARRGLVLNVAATILGIVYVPFLAGFALLMLRFPGALGTNVFLTVIGLTILYDICAYAIGSLWGSRPMAPTVSPRKSWEGAVGASLVLLLVGLALVPTIDPFTPARAVGLALVIAVAAPIGDLVESAVKRDLGIKDMGTILPGHGGILDRIDSILLTAPAAYYFLRLSFM